MEQHKDLIKTLRWIAANDEIVFNAETASEAAELLENQQNEVKHLKMRLEIEKDHSEQMKRERDAAVESMRGDCKYCQHGGVTCLDELCGKCSHFAAKEFIEGDYWEWRGPQNKEE